MNCRERVKRRGCSSFNITRHYQLNQYSSAHHWEWERLGGQKVAYQNQWEGFQARDPEDKASATEVSGMVSNGKSWF